MNKQQLVRYITKWNDDDNRAKLDLYRRYLTNTDIPNYAQSDDLEYYRIQNKLSDSMILDKTVDGAMSMQEIIGTITDEKIEKMLTTNRKIAELTKPYKNEYVLFIDKINDIAEFIYYANTNIKGSKTILEPNTLNTILINIKSILIRLDKIEDETKYLKILKGFHYCIVEYLAKRDNNCSLPTTQKEQINFNKNIKKYNEDRLSKNTASHIANLGFYFVFYDVYNFDVKDLEDFNHQKPFRPYKDTRTATLKNDMFVTYYSNKKTT